MMRCFLIFFHLLLFDCTNAQVLIHAHNDYEKPQPLINAINNRVFSLEADVFLVDGKLLIAHQLRQVDTAKSLLSMYILPMIQMFHDHGGHISNDTSYKVTLMIDVKSEGKNVLKELVRLIESFQNYFDRNKNPAAVRIVISGDRGDIAEWNSYPNFIFFDGRPDERYDQQILNRVAFISENYWKYVSLSKPDDFDKLKEIINTVHQSKKPVRFWAIPDTEKSWLQLKNLGVDIINTDKVDACSNFFK